MGRPCATHWPLAALIAAAAVPLAAGGNFVASLHTHYVVNLDFEGDAHALGPGGAEASEDDVKVMSFAGGEKKFRCRLPSSKNRTGDTPDITKARAHFLGAKLAPLRGTCWKLRKDYWSYDVCFGRRVTQYRPDTDMRFSLGEYHTGSEELLDSGGARELYTGGTDNRTTEVLYVCGSSEASTRSFKLEESSPLFYTVVVTSPQFCAWPENDGVETTDDQGNILKVSSLLEELRDACINVTQGWWTYEYCYPRSLTQFHLNGKKRDPEYVLGTLNGTDAVTAVNRVNMTTIRLKPSISPRERRAPPSNHWTLQQRLGGGTVCDETNRARSTSMRFQCPTNWQSRPETRIVSISESSLCEYEIMVHTTLVCGHRKFIPTMPRGKETIQCVVEPKGA